MRTGRIALLLATIAFGIAVAFGTTTVSTAPHTTTDISTGINPDGGMPYD